MPPPAHPSRRPAHHPCANPNPVPLAGTRLLCSISGISQTHFSFLAMTLVLLPQTPSRKARLFVAPPHRSPPALSRACVFERRDDVGTGEIGVSAAQRVLGRCRLAETSMASSAERASYAQSVPTSITHRLVFVQPLSLLPE